MSSVDDQCDTDDDLAAWVDRVDGLASVFPQVERMPAWIGVRWRVRGSTFGHVAPISDGGPASYAEASGVLTGRAVCLTFHIDGPEREALEHLGHPFFKPIWSPTVMGLLLNGQTDTDEVRELLTESYCLRAPKRLAALVDRPPGNGGSAVVTLR